MGHDRLRRIGPARGALLAGLVAAAGAGAPARAQAQTQLAGRIAAAGDGVVRMSFAARPDVCGTAGGGISVGGHSDDGWVADCEHGPVYVSLTVRQGQVRRVAAHVAGHWSAPAAARHDLGRVGARSAADYLLELGRRTPDDRVGAEAVRAAALADSAVIWPTLAELARRGLATAGGGTAGRGQGGSVGAGVGRRTRAAALFWLAQRAAAVAVPRGAGTGRAVTSGVRGGGEESVRRAAVFALSQQPRAVAVPALLKAYRDSRDPGVRRSALFWLGQSGDPRAIDLFVSILQR